MHFDLPLQDEATEAHTIPGLKHSPLNTNKLVAVGQADKVIFYDVNDINQSALQQAVLKGWYMSEEGIWHIPLETRENIILINKDTYLSKKSSLEILGNSKQPPVKQIKHV